MRHQEWLIGLGLLMWFGGWVVLAWIFDGLQAVAAKLRARLDRKDDR